MVITLDFGSNDESSILSIPTKIDKRYNFMNPIINIHGTGISPNKEKLKFTLERAVKLGFRVEKDGTLTKNGKIIKVNSRHSGPRTYLRTNIVYKHVSYTLNVHQLQAYQKFGNELFKDGIVVRHLNDISDDNSWDNIAIGSYKDNSSDISEEKKKLMIPKPKYDYKEVKELREKGLTYKQIMEVTGIKSKSTVSRIINDIKCNKRIKYGL